MESGILGFGIRNTAQGVRNRINDWNSESRILLQRLESTEFLESGSHDMESRIQDCLGFPYIGRHLVMSDIGVLIE